MSASEALSQYMFIGVILLVVGLVLLYLFDLAYPEQVQSVETLQPLLPENYAVNVTERLIEEYWQAWKESVKDD